MPRAHRSPETGFLGEPFKVSPFEALPGSARRIPEWLHHALCVCIFLAAFLLATALLRDLVRPADRSLVSAKLQEIEADPEGYDVLFLGNSHVYRGVDARAFDARMAELGHPVRSYNLGGQAMMFPELDFTVRALLERPPSRLSWLFLDLSFGWVIDQRNFGSGRVIWWHDLRALWLACRLVLDSGRPWTERLEFLTHHLADYASRLTNQGRGLDYVRWRLSGRGGSADELIGHDRGFQELAIGLADAADQRTRRFSAFLARYTKWVLDLSKKPTEFVPLLGEPAHRMRELLTRLEEHGIRPVLYMPPYLKNQVPQLASTASGRTETVFLFNQPACYPQLYQAEQRFDANHLNGAGARLFSTLLAEEFARSLEQTSSD
ncbi:MAG: hypothetical protein AB1486_19620 [Planctomycetota bacterium]